MERELGVSLRDVEAAEAETVRKLAADRGVGARCGNGLFSTYKSPKFYLSFTILVSFILVKYPDKIGIVNTYQYGTSKYTVRCGRQTGMGIQHRFKG